MVTGRYAPAHTIDRPALRSELDAALTTPLALVIAQAGAGKSVLLAQWADGHPELGVVWIDVVAEDDDPVHFFRQLLTGLLAVDIDLRHLAILMAMGDGGLGSPLVGAVAEQLGRRGDLVLVLDDLHNLSNPRLIADIGGLIDLAPPNVHVVLSTRVDLPLAWSRHRLRDDLVEIRQADLAFNEAESSELLERVVGYPVDPAGVSALMNRTEGWAAGLQLAGMTLRSREHPDEFIAQFSGSDRLVADYLSEEVLQAQSAPRRSLLLRMSVLDRMCAELVTHLTDETEVQLLFEDLERNSMFLVPLDDHREWFRFHHLFRDLLRYHLRAEDAAAESELLERAASWHLERGEVQPAVEYLLRAKDWDRALDVILSRGSEVIERSEMATMVRWITQVPETVRAERLDATLLLGVLKAVAGRAAEAEDILSAAARDHRFSLAQRACAVTILASLVQWRPHPEVTLELAARALRLIEENGDDPTPDLLNITDRRSLETIALTAGGRAHFLAGHIDVARQWLERALVSEGAAFSLWRVNTLGSLALLEAWCGRTGRADELADEAFALARAVGTLTQPSIADSYLAAALAALERGELKQAELFLYEGSSRATSNSRTQLLWVVHVEFALLRAADGKQDRHAAPMGPPPPIVLDRLLALRSRSLRLKGSEDQALRCLLDATSPSPSVSVERIAAQLALKLTDDARAGLAADAATAPSEPLALVERFILRAWLADAERHVGEVRRYLSDALELAGAYGLIDVFLRAGPHVLRLVDEFSGSAQEVRHAVLDRAGDLLAPVTERALADPLTDRELEILTYLPTRFTNIELADRFFVSVNTIKTHMAHIFRKLDVSNRDDAISRARQLGLLQSSA